VEEVAETVEETAETAEQTLPTLSLLEELAPMDNTPAPQPRPAMGAMVSALLSNMEEQRLADRRAIAQEPSADAEPSPVPADGKFSTKERRKHYHNEAQLVVPEGYLEIRAGACAGLDKLESVILPNTIVKIGSGAFSDSAALKEIYIPLSVKEIASDAFEGCESLTKVTMPFALEWLANELFENEVDITWLEPEKEDNGIAEDGKFTRKIRKEIYDGGSMLIIPEGYIEIRPGACAGLDDVTEVVLPQTLQKICGGAFSECSSLVSLDIPASVTELEEDAFEDCTSLRMVAIPSHLEAQAKACFPTADLMVLD
ncbi:MAG TPA: hypothetical protein DCG49_09805, partial [Ruminococcus sp.]|nr:hypothetical protein [Ruminococcus sp.]